MNLQAAPGRKESASPQTSHGRKYVVCARFTIFRRVGFGLVRSP